MAESENITYSTSKIAVKGGPDANVVAAVPSSHHSPYHYQLRTLTHRNSKELERVQLRVTCTINHDECDFQVKLR